MIKMQNGMLMELQSIFFVLLSEEISFVSGVVLTCTETVSLVETQKEAILFTDSGMNGQIKQL